MNGHVAILFLGAALAIGPIQAQETEKVPKLSETQKTVVKLLQAELQNAQLTVQLLLTRANAAQAQSRAKQAELDAEILRLHKIKEAPESKFSFSLSTLTFSKKVKGDNE